MTLNYEIRKDNRLDRFRGNMLEYADSSNSRSEHKEFDEYSVQSNSPLNKIDIKYAIPKVEHYNRDCEDKSSHSINVDNTCKYSVNPFQDKFKFLKRDESRSNSNDTQLHIDYINDGCSYYQQHWFCASIERLKFEDRSRDEKLEITRYELKKHLRQIMKSKVGQRREMIENNTLQTNYALEKSHQTHSIPVSSHFKLVASQICDIQNCHHPALPCTHFCALHIMENSDQVLFNYCTAKFADNTQCSIPVFDITHELPLCPEHARKRDNYKLYQEAKPKKLRKKVKPSAMIRPQKRSKKRKKIIRNLEDDTTSEFNVTDMAATSGLCKKEPLEPVEDVVEEVLALQVPDSLELVSVEQALVTQASHLLEESEITNVLNTIQADEFNDFFSVNRNGEYEPSREEEEELERALAAVDNDVKSLEKLSQSQGLLDSLLDENALADSLVQIPEFSFHNGYSPCGEVIVSQPTRLLPVNPHSHM